jgi:hypothetical protein
MEIIQASCIVAMILLCFVFSISMIGALVSAKLDRAEWVDNFLFVTVLSLALMFPVGIIGAMTAPTQE